MGLLVAFTFSGAATRFDDRRHLIVDEANAIGTAYARLDLLAPGPRQELRELFRRYVDGRLAIYRAVPDRAKVRAAVAHAAALSRKSGSAPGRALTGVRSAGGIRHGRQPIAELGTYPPPLRHHRRQGFWAPSRRPNSSPRSGRMWVASSSGVCPSRHIARCLNRGAKWLGHPELAAGNTANPSRSGASRSRWSSVTSARVLG